MSLLMKALEKAAQDRDKSTPGTPLQTAGKAAGRELALESVELKPGIKADENTSRVPMSPKRAASAPVNPPPRGVSTPSAGKDNPRSGAQARAANVLIAQQQPRSSAAAAVEWMRARPVYVLGGLAAIFLLAYGGYVYVQVAHPGLLQKSPPAAVATAPVLVPAPPATPDAAATGAPLSGDSANSPFVSLQSVVGDRSENPSSQASVSASSASSSPSASQELSGSVPPRPAPPSAAVAATPPAPPATPPATPPSRIAVSRGDTAVARVNTTVSEAYSALEASQFETAQRLYSQVLRSEPANVDALLGLAAVAQQANRTEEAQRHFLAILDVDPRNALAQSGLIALVSRADPQAAESRLKQLLARDSSPPLYFTLGNVYADQGLWPQAQQAYFQAHSMEPRNPDYAYNLAVGLEHLGQQKLALEFYRKAAQLASAKGSANFDTARIQERITQLAARLE